MTTRIAREGLPFVLPAWFICLILLTMGWWILSAVFFLTGIVLGLFFRDPDREIPQEAGLIVSPADGKIVGLERSEEGQIVSIFLSIFDVHINRAPVAGTIASQEYRSGVFHLAFDERASFENEQMVWQIRGEDSVRFSLIAGWVARRIVAWRQVGDSVARGDRIGLIKFGSRVDITIPAGFAIRVALGQRVQGGSSVLAARENGNWVTAKV